MNRIEEFQTTLSTKGKSVFGYTVDWIEWSARKNLEIADDFADFTVAQLRLPLEAEDFTDYRLGLRDTYSELGDVLKQYGEEYVARVKEIPADVREILVPKKAARKTAAKRKVAKPKVARAKASKPRVAKPKTAKPKAAKAKSVKPKTAGTTKAVKAEPASGTASA